MEISNYKRTVDQVTEILESMRKDINKGNNTTLQNITVVTDLPQSEELLINLMREIYQHCENLANLTGGFLYIVLCDRIISVERLGLYVDDVGFLVDIQLNVTALVYKGFEQIFYKKLYIKI